MRLTLIDPPQMLGVALAAHALADGAQVVWVDGDDDRPVDGVRLGQTIAAEVDRIARRETLAHQDETRATGEPRFTCVASGELDSAAVPHGLAGAAADGVWLFERPRDERSLDRALVICAGIVRQATILTLVLGQRGAAAADDQRMRASRLAEWCRARGVAHRLMWIPRVVSTALVDLAASRLDLLEWLRPLDEVIAEACERHREYFDFRGLRIVWPVAEMLAVIPASEAARAMLSLTDAAGKEGPRAFEICGGLTLGRDEWCDLVGEAYGIGLVPVDHESELNAIDRVLHQELGASGFSTGPIAAGPRGLAPCRVDVRTDLDVATLCALVEALRRAQQAARAERDPPPDTLFAPARARTIDRDGETLTYAVEGTRGTPLVILNALGQGLFYWTRLIERLRDRYRVVIWEMRGLRSAAPIGLMDHVEDVKAVLDAEGLRDVVLVGWCTGPQLATEFCLRYPDAVAGMVFLSSAFHIAGRADLETDYAANVEALFRTLTDHPKLAASVMRSLAVQPPDAVAPDGPSDGETEAAQVLAATNVRLRAEVVAPYRSLETTTRYARQVLDLLDFNTLERAAEIKVPVLVVSCECDKVALSLKSREVAARFLHSRHVEVPGASHYAFYDRPSQIYALLHQFVRGLGRVA